MKISAWNTNKTNSITRMKGATWIKKKIGWFLRIKEKPIKNINFGIEYSRFNSEILCPKLRNLGCNLLRTLALNESSKHSFYKIEEGIWVRTKMLN